MQYPQRFLLQLADEDRRRIEELARVRGVTMSQAVRDAIESEHQRSVRDSRARSHAPRPRA